MAVTAKLGLTLLEVGQKEKEVTINTNMSTIDAASFQGKFTSDPSPASLKPGATYYNTATSKLRVLIDATTWTNAA